MIDAPLWTAPTIAAATGGRTAGDWHVDGIAIDSREIVPGDLFIALSGAETNGHRFVAAAFEAGAAGALVSGPVEGVAATDPRLVTVANTQAALEALAGAARARMQGHVAAVTGSAGKTSVKEALRRALGWDALAHASVRSFNNHVGAPLSLARMPRQARYGIFELGMNGPAEIAPLSTLVKPHVTVVTTVGAAHAHAFDDIAGIAEAKAEIFAGLEPGGTAVIGIDHPFADLLAERARDAGARVVRVSLAEAGADAAPLRLAAGPDGTAMTARIGDTVLTCRIGAAGRHWALNALIVLAAVDALGGDLGLAGLTLAQMRAPAGRGAVHTVEGRDGAFLVIDESYNANPLSLAAAFETLAGAEGRDRRLAVLADMAELGPDAERYHLELAAPLKAANVDRAFTIGPYSKALAQAAGCDVVACADAAEALAQLRRSVVPGDTVLVKGSNRAGLAKVVEGLVSSGRPVSHRADGPFLAAE